MESDNLACLAQCQSFFNQGSIESLGSMSKLMQEDSTKNSTKFYTIPVFILFFKKNLGKAEVFLCCGTHFLCS